jgi:hypothetical protein
LGGRDLVRAWEASGQIGVVRVAIPSIRQAVEKYIADGEARNLNKESLKKMRDAVERLFLTKNGYRLLKQLGVDEIREFRNSLVKKYASSSAQTRLEYVRGFLRFCQGSEWTATNPALAVKPPRSDSSPTLPFLLVRASGQLQRYLHHCVGCWLITSFRALGEQTGNVGPGVEGEASSRLKRPTARGKSASRIMEGS